MDPRNLIIGTWKTVIGEAYQTYREDGRTSVKALDVEMKGTYEFIDDHTIKATYVIDPRNNRTRTITSRVEVTKDELTFFDSEGPHRNKRVR
jgi:hypothetical protein